MSAAAASTTSNPGATASRALLAVRDLEVVYATEAGLLAALSEVTFDVHPGEIVGIVGESGCGKSTLSGALLRLLPANGEITAGQIVFQGRNLLAESDEDMRRRRGRDIAMIFQDPLTSLNPTFKIGTQMIDTQRVHRRRGSEHPRTRAVQMLDRVGIPDPRSRLDRYPHEFSGGMRQRIVIAMALLQEPALLIADEPTSALDVTLQAQILALLEDLRRERGTAILLISHDLGVIAQVCDRVVVMYAGRIVESGGANEVFESPLHPYTRALLGSVPSRERRGTPLTSIPGRVPALSALPEGCKFADRCDLAQTICREREPALRLSGDRPVRCVLYAERE